MPLTVMALQGTMVHRLKTTSLDISGTNFIYGWVDLICRGENMSLYVDNEPEPMCNLVCALFTRLP